MDAKKLMHMCGADAFVNSQSNFHSVETVELSVGNGVEFRLGKHTRRG
jgi:hypothetical protein